MFDVISFLKNVGWGQNVWPPPQIFSTKLMKMFTSKIMMKIKDKSVLYVQVSCTILDIINWNPMIGCQFVNKKDDFQQSN